MLCDVVRRRRGWHTLLAILTIRKELYGFLFLCIGVVPFSIIMGLRLAALWAAGAPLLDNGRPKPLDRFSKDLLALNNLLVRAVLNYEVCIVIITSLVTQKCHSISHSTTRQ